MTYDIAVVGAGLIGATHIEYVKADPDTVLAAVVDPSPDAGERFGAPHFPDLDAMFAALTPDGVILATPNALHVEQALACVARGVPVLVEKPVAVSVAQAQELVDAAESAKVPVLVGHHRRFNPIVVEAKRIVASGALGRVRTVHAQCWYYKPDYYFEEAPWRTKAGAGPVLVNAIHDIDLMRYLCGEIAEVHAMRSPALRGFENEDGAVATLRFADGALGSYTLSDAVASPWSWELTSGENPRYPHTQENSLLIGGSEASLSVPDLRVWSHVGKPDWWAPISATDTAYPRGQSYATQLRHFTAVIAGDEAPLVSAREGMETLRVVESILADPSQPT